MEANLKSTTLWMTVLVLGLSFAGMLTGHFEAAMVKEIMMTALGAFAFKSVGHAVANKLGGK